MSRIVNIILYRIGRWKNFQWYFGGLCLIVDIRTCHIDIQGRVRGGARVQEFPDDVHGNALRTAVMGWKPFRDAISFGNVLREVTRK